MSYSPEETTLTTYFSLLQRHSKADFNDALRKSLASCNDIARLPINGDAESVAGSLDDAPAEDAR